MQPTKTQAIAAFLKAKTHEDLACLYSHDMECQITVSQDGGTRIDGEYRGRKWNGYTDGFQTWKPIRIPLNASTEPVFEDTKMTWELEAHVEAIGMTGWDWQKRISRWVAFDFDAIVGHSDKHEKKLTDSELSKIKDDLSAIPWVTIRKSTGGKGLHIYVFVRSVETSNHTEHAALARAILGKMSALVGADLAAKVDVCGSNMWVWHRKMQASGGLELLKQGSVLEDIPANWREHVKVISGHRKKALPKFIDTPELESLFTDLTGQSVQIPLDEDHLKLLKWLEDRQTGSWWSPDHHMLVTHTSLLKEAHNDLSLRGIFETIATGQEKECDINCYCFPLRRGGWSVRRYTPGVSEHDSWEQDGKGWTRCYFNVLPDLVSASKSNGGLEHPKGGFVFRQAEMAELAASKIGAHFKVPVPLRTQEATIKEKGDGKIVVSIKADVNTNVGGEMQGWIYEKGFFKKVFQIAAPQTKDTEVTNYDDSVRHLISEANEDSGWVLRGDEGLWRYEPLTHIRSALEAMNLGDAEIKNIIGSSVIRCWTVINRPFQPEYPGNRKWNRDAAQLRFIPTPDTDHLKYPTWKKILDHCGKGLNDALSENAWAVANGITNGGDYLKLWIASVFKEPDQPLPYLFLYGPQDSGKSLFHESLSLLVTKGVSRAENALTNDKGFNGEIASAILCVTEEIDLRKNRVANNRVKDWVTTRDLPVHPKGGTPYLAKNHTHWIQCSNDKDAAPIFPGDTRIVMLYVESLDPIEKIPKKQMLPLLEKEAPDFLAELLSLELPPSNDRLNIPVIRTLDKVDSENLSKTQLELFLSEKCHHVNGSMILVSEFFEEFMKFCDSSESGAWSKRRIGQEMPMIFPKGRRTQDSQACYGNISFKPGPHGHRLKAIQKKEFVFLVPE